MEETIETAKETAIETAIETALEITLETVEKVEKVEKGRKAVQLSRRLKALANLVTPGNVAADVGCDHGFLSIYLIEQGISPRVIASDVRKGPLSAARAHVAERGLSTYIETRLSDGLCAYYPGEAQTLICAGMGGRLMQRILLQSMETAKGFQELILQPQSELWQFRIFLREQGFSVTDEKILEEDGKYYFLFRVRPGEEKTPQDRLGDKYGAGLLRERNPLLMRYLEKLLANCQAVRETLLTHRGEAGGRVRLEESLRENAAETEDLRAALALLRENSPESTGEYI